MTKSIWVTGADGFIGRHLGRRLTAEGHRTSGLGYRRRTDNELDDVAWTDWEVGEIVHPLLNALGERQGAPDVIFHLAGGGSVGASFADPWKDFQATVLSTAALTDWMRLCAPKARLVQISSAAVYGAGHSGPIAEDAALAPFSPYGAHKRVAENLCAAATVNFSIETVIVRPFSIFGPGLRKQLLWDCCNRLAGRPDALELGGTGDELRDWLEVGELVHILSSMVSCDVSSNSTFNAGTGHPVSVRQVVEALLGAWGSPGLPLSFSGTTRPGDPFSLIADTTRLAGLGLTPQSNIHAAVAAYVDWFRQQ